MADSDNENLCAATLDGFRSGDHAAFEAVVRRYQRPIRLWLAAHCPPGGDVDDVAQRTFLAAYTRIAEFQPGTNFEAWLFAIARYQLMTEATVLRRRADYHSRFSHDLLARELERRAPEPAALMEERLRHLASCLERVSESERQVLDWRYREQVPLEQMAARLGRSLAAVKKLLWVLRGKIRACIESKLAAEA